MGQGTKILVKILLNCPGYAMIVQSEQGAMQ